MQLCIATPVPRTSVARTYRDVEYDMSWDIRNEEILGISERGVSSLLNERFCDATSVEGPRTNEISSLTDDTRDKKT